MTSTLQPGQPEEPDSPKVEQANKQVNKQSGQQAGRQRNHQTAQKQAVFAVESLQRVDAWEFARTARQIQGTSPQSQFKRLLEALHPVDSVTESGLQNTAGRVGQRGYARQPEVVQWTIEGHADRDGRCAVRLQGQFEARVTCMRCSSAVEMNIAFDRRLRLCKSEQEADQLDTGDDEDAVAAAGRVDLMQWLEDELLLSLPMFPVHDLCESVGQAEEYAVSGAQHRDASVQEAGQDSDGASQFEAAPTQGSLANPARLGQSQPDHAARQTANEETHRPFETLARLMKKSDKP